MGEIKYVTDEDLKLILKKYGYTFMDTKIENVEVINVGDKQMLGFQADYLKLKVDLRINEERRTLQFFIKAVSKTNEAKAKMATETSFFQNEMMFFDDVQTKIELSDLKPWCARFVTNLKDAIVFEDLTAQQFKMRSRHEKFDELHILEALKTLARLHGNTIIYEENKSKELQRPYSIYEDNEHCLGKGFFRKENAWFTQCRHSSLEVVKEFSKYKNDKSLMKMIEERWFDAWDLVYDLSGPSFKHRNVVSHRDLWNNNILFHYNEEEGNGLVPDNCLLVDFQSASYQPPAGDVMFLLHCNLTPQYRKENLDMLLSFYYRELKQLLSNYSIDIEEVVPKDSFIESAAEQNLWGLVVHASLGPVFWLDDDISMETFSDPAQFDQILLKNKAAFMSAFMRQNCEYKHYVMEIFDEFVDYYILNKFEQK